MIKRQYGPQSALAAFCMSRVLHLPLLASLTLLPPAAYSQSVSVGIKAGVPITNPYTLQQIPDGGDQAHTSRYTVGPTVELHLPFRFSIEADALWRHNSFSTIGGHYSQDLSSSVNEWQIPLLAKYELIGGPFRPFVDGGVVYRHVSNTASGVPAPSHPNTAGVSLGGGITLKFGPLRISPEIRYTRWTKPAFADFYIPVSSVENQADFLLGITF